MELLKRCPSVAFAVQYGSSVLRRPNKGIDSAAQIDLILAVDDPLAWHTENLAKNSAHYSKYVKQQGAQFIVESCAAAAHIHYNPYVDIGDKVAPRQTYKYGVIGVNDLVNDLTQWETFYLAGRLQKPV
jgi:translocator assembly and maintenance protein 41